jgi:hypothetical protein
MQEARAQLVVGEQLASEELSKLGEAVCEAYKNDTVYTQIKTRMQRKMAGLAQQVKSFGLCDVIDEIMASYSGCNSRKEQIMSLKKRKALYKKLADQATEEYVYLTVNPDVCDMQTNPFVPISYQTALRPPVIRLLNLLDVSGDALTKAVEEGKSRHSDRYRC